MRRSSRLAKKKKVNYGEEHMWEKAVRKAEKDRSKLERTKGKRKALKKEPKKIRIPKARFRKQVKRVKQEEVIYDDRDDEKLGEVPAPAGAYMPWEKPGWDPANENAGEDWNAFLEKPQQRVERIVTAKKSKRPQPVFTPIFLSKRRKQLLFMNPGEKPIMAATYALARGGPLPAWTTPFRWNLYLRGNELWFRDQHVDLPMALPDEKRVEVKALYFNPKEPSTIQPITDELRGKFANISRANVISVLRSLETYQRNFGRRIPPKIASRTMLRQPGILAIDMFFPSAQLGWWGKFNCLCCMDTWSRFCRVYALEHKDYESTKRALNSFLQEFASFGFLPRRILADKGTDLAPAKELMERYRLPRDQNDDMVLHSKTGQPVLIVEALNAQVQRRMQVFRTSKLTDDPSVILEDITDQLNNQKRPDRGNLTPLQLLSLNGEQRAQVNTLHRDRNFGGLETDLKPLRVGHTVRILLWDRKEQVKGGLGARFKGFAPKWSKRTHTILKRTALRRNPGVFTYHVGLGQEYYRHELLRIPKKVDRGVPQGYVHHEQQVVVPEEEDWDQFDDPPSEDSY